MKFSNTLNNTPYRPQRVLGISKLSTLDFLKNQNRDLNEDQILMRMKEFGKEPQEIVHEHYKQIAVEKNLANVLKNLDINFRIIKRLKNPGTCVKWAELVIPIGGDGTFLLASKLIKDNKKPILGINPNMETESSTFSLPSKYSENVEIIFEKLFAGNYSLLMRSRIRTTMTGEGLYRKPFHVHEKSRPYGEKRTENILRSKQRKIADALQPRERILPWLALNEVFMGEFLAARPITLNVQFDQEKEYVIRSSGLCVCTGSGSRSWYKAMNLQSAEIMQKVVALATGKILSQQETTDLLIRYHSNLVYSPEDQRMMYMIHEMYRTSRCTKSKFLPERQACRKVKVKSCGFDAGLVLDGCFSLPFNDGATATFDTRPEYALKHVIMK